MLWENLRSEEFDEAIERSKGLCVVPVGCIEKHGHHLPVGADWFEGISLCTMAAEMEEAVVFPTGAWVGDVCGAHSMKHPEDYGQRGYIAISPNTLMTVIMELCDEIHRNGFDKILLVSAHGGNDGLMEMLGKQYRYADKDYVMLTCETIGRNKESYMPYFYEMIKARRDEFPDITDEDMAVLKDHADRKTNVGHADFVETAMVMGLRPELVRLDRHHLGSGASRHRTDHLAQAGLIGSFYWGSDYPDSYSGVSPEGLTEAIGKAHVRVLAERLARIYKAFKEDTDAYRMLKRLPKE